MRKLFVLGLVAAAAVATSTLCRAQDKPSPKPATAEPIKKPIPGPFHGKLAALDRSAKTITVGKRTFQITADTKITRAGKPATLDAGVVGEEVSGYIKPTESGKLLATTVHFGPKTDPKAVEPTRAK